MQNLIRKFDALQIKRKMPVLRPGDTIKVYQKIKEGDKERVQFFEGTVIRINSGYGMSATFTVRKIASGIGVEKNFPFHLPSIVKLEILKRGKVRRAKLYYLRRKQEKRSKLKEKDISAEDLEKMGFDEVKEKEAAKKKAEAEAKKATDAKKSIKEENKPVLQKDKQTAVSKTKKVDQIKAQEDIKIQKVEKTEKK